MQDNSQAIGRITRCFAQFAVLHRTYLEFCRKALSDDGLSRTEIGLLLALTENCNAANDLCRALPLSKGMVSQALAALQKKELLVIDRSPEDRRVHPISLTPRGEAVVGRLERAAAAFLQRMMQGVEETEMAQAEATMEKIQQNMEQIKGTL